MPLFFFLFLAITGSKIKIVGCFKENPAKKNIPTLLFSDIKSVNSKTKVDYKNFQQYILKLIQRCASATAKKNFGGFFAIHNIGKHMKTLFLLFACSKGKFCC